MDVEEGKSIPTRFYECPFVNGIYIDILEAIGVGCNGKLSVYKARQTVLGKAYTVGFMCVNENEVETKSWLQLQYQAYQRNSLRTSLYGTLHICSTFSSGGYYCLWFNYPNQGSLLSFMARRFPRGLPEKLILFVACHILAPLRKIHGCGLTHGEISAAHVFVAGGYDGSAASVTLSYAASVHHLLADQLRDSHSPAYLPATSACRWAAAPGSTDHDTRADDIWSIGITLLEMAYGGLRVEKRDHLDFLINNIRNKNKLPTKFNGDITKVKWASSSFLPTCCSLIAKKKQIAPTGDEYKVHEDRVFSKGFVNLVVRCLHLDPAKRPTADQLFRSKILNRARRTRYFSLE